MWKQRAATLCGCLAALPLLVGCADGVSAPPQAYTPPPQIYAVGPAAPAAILVMLPGPGDALPGAGNALTGPGDALTADPRLWAAQGFDVATPSPPEMYRIAADQQAAVARLIAEAQAVADAPVWLVGPNPAIAAAMGSLPAAGAGQVSGVVVTSTSSGDGTCSERMIYSSPGNGAAPRVSVSSSGNACPSGSSFGARPRSTIAPPPMARPNAPRLIETSAPTGSRTLGAAPLGAPGRQVADLIAPPS